MFAENDKRKKKNTILREMYRDTLDMDISFDVPVSRPALLRRKNVPRTGTSSGRNRVTVYTRVMYDI